MLTGRVSCRLDPSVYTVVLLLNTFRELMIMKKQVDVTFYEKLVELIESNITTDDFPSWKKGSRIYKLYENADNRTKGMIDNLFIHLCGYTLETLIKQASNPMENRITNGTT